MVTKNYKTLFGLIFLLCGVIVFLIAVFLIFSLQNDIRQMKNDDFKRIEKIVQIETELVHIEEVERFHGEQSYYVVFGQTDEKKDQIIFVPMDEKNKADQMMIIDGGEIVPAESILENWMKECDRCTLIKIIPGILDDYPIWELTYIDERERYVFDYLSLYDGTPYEQLRFKKNFK